MSFDLVDYETNVGIDTLSAQQAGDLPSTSGIAVWSTAANSIGDDAIGHGLAIQLRNDIVRESVVPRTSVVGRELELHGLSLCRKDGQIV